MTMMGSLKPTMNAASASRCVTLMLLWAAAAASPTMAQAAQPAVLLRGPQTVITADDIRVDAERIPLEMRASVLERSTTVSQIATNLYIRRVMAEKAQQLGLGNTEEVQATLRLARDKVLSDAYLAQIEKKHALSDRAAEGQALSLYKAKPELAKTPEQVHVRHILIAGQDDAARTKAQSLLESLKQGADFAQLARENSADKGSAEKGGDLGLFARGRMVPEFEDAAFALQKPEELSGIVKTPFGYHIIQLQERRPVGKQPFEAVRETLMADIRKDVAQQAKVQEADAIRAQAELQSDAIEAFTRTYRNAAKPQAPR